MNGDWFTVQGLGFRISGLRALQFGRFWRHRWCGSTPSPIRQGQWQEQGVRTSREGQVCQEVQGDTPSQLSTETTLTSQPRGSALTLQLSPLGPLSAVSSSQPRPSVPLTHPTNASQFYKLEQLQKLLHKEHVEILMFQHSPARLPRCKVLSAARHSL